MPNRKKHNKVTKMVLPWVSEKKIDRVNKRIDSGVKKYGGKKHRYYDEHDGARGVAKTLKKRGPIEAAINIAHQDTDRLKKRIDELKKGNISGTFAELTPIGKVGLFLHKEKERKRLKKRR